MRKVIHQNEEIHPSKLVIISYYFPTLISLYLIGGYIVCEGLIWHSNAEIEFPRHFVMDPRRLTTSSR